MWSEGAGAPGEVCLDSVLEGVERNRDDAAASWWTESPNSIAYALQDPTASGMTQSITVTAVATK